MNLTALVLRRCAVVPYVAGACCKHDAEKGTAMFPARKTRVETRAEHTGFIRRVPFSVIIAVTARAEKSIPFSDNVIL